MPNGRRSNRQGPRQPRRGLGFQIRFRDGEGQVPPELFEETARHAAEVVAQGKREVNKSYQLRRFYDELSMWEERVRQDERKFKDYLPFIKMLKAKAAYAEGRGHVDGAFVDMLEQMIDFIRKPEDLYLAKTFFEAFLGFYRRYKGD